MTLSDICFAPNLKWITKGFFEKWVGCHSEEKFLATNSNKMQFIPIKTRPLLPPKDNIFDIFDNYVKDLKD
jgi:hypothetical protein